MNAKNKRNYTPTTIIRDTVRFHKMFSPFCETLGTKENSIYKFRTLMQPQICTLCCDWKLSLPVDYIFRKTLTYCWYCAIRVYDHYEILRQSRAHCVNQNRLKRFNEEQTRNKLSLCKFRCKSDKIVAV